MPQKLKHRIAMILRETGLSQAALARIAGVSRQAVQQWLNGTTEIELAKTVFKIQDALGYDARWIALGDGPQIAELKDNPGLREKLLEIASYMEVDAEELRKIAGMMNKVKIRPKKKK